MSGISIEALTKQWGEVSVLSGIDFVAEPGKLVVLLGPSGCGKSTTLRIVAGLETATSGRILFGDREVTSLTPAQRGLSMVFQSYALFPHLSVKENILFGLKVRKVAPAEQDRRLQRAADILGIGQLFDRRPAALSGGQRQRVALARAIVAETSICLMDEPLSNLDAQLRNDMRTEIRGLQQRLGMTMLYVTHDQTEAMTMADKVVLLRNGKIEQQGTPKELYRRPASDFVARFLGSPAMNVLSLDDAELRRSFGAVAGEQFDGAARMVGLRAEALTVGSSGVPAKVTAVEYLGADTILHCDIAGQRVTARVPREDDFEPGADVALSWAHGALHQFDAEGRRLGDRP